MQSTNQRGIIATIMTRSITFSEFLDTIGLQKFTGSLVDFAIRDYQRYISPHKGFSCAHRKLYGKASCSGYFRESVAKEGLSKSLQLFPDRLAECKEAYIILQSQKFGSKKNSEKNKEQKRKEAHNTEQSGCDCGSAIDPSICCDTNGCDTNGCDTNGCDTNGCDTNGCDTDCSSCDFGSCDFGGCDCSP